MIVDQVQWYKDNVVDKIKPSMNRTEITKGRAMLSIDGWKYDEETYNSVDQVLDVIKQKYLEDMNG